jgi:hypothetical protein
LTGALSDHGTGVGSGDEHARTVPDHVETRVGEDAVGVSSVVSDLTDPDAVEMRCRRARDRWLLDVRRRVRHRTRLRAFAARQVA